MCALPRFSRDNTTHKRYHVQPHASDCVSTLSRWDTASKAVGRASLAILNLSGIPPHSSDRCNFVRYPRKRDAFRHSSSVAAAADSCPSTRFSADCHLPGAEVSLAPSRCEKQQPQQRIGDVSSLFTWLIFCLKVKTRFSDANLDPLPLFARRLRSR